MAAGAANATVSFPTPRVSVGAAGAEGVVAGTVDAEAVDAVPLPATLVASTVHVYVLPFVKVDTTIDEVAPEFDPAAPPSLDVQLAV